MHASTSHTGSKIVHIIPKRIEGQGGIGMPPRGELTHHSEELPPNDPFAPLGLLHAANTADLGLEGGW